jgi:hypothetical protein
MAGPQSVVPRAGYVLIPPGATGFGYDAWHNETPDTFTCGAQSVRGVNRVISRGALPSGILPWAATFQRAVPLAAAESQLPVSRLVRLDANGEVLVQSGTVEATPQYGTLGNAFDGISPIPSAATAWTSSRRPARSSQRGSSRSSIEASGRPPGPDQS